MIIHEFSPVVVCLQEIMLGRETPCPREYFQFRTPFDPVVGSHGGSLIYVRQDIPHVDLQLNTNLDAVAIQLDLNRKYTLCSLYLHPNEQIDYNDLDNLIRQLPRPFIILGDMNGRHLLWGDVISNTRGNLLADFIENEDIGTILNSGEYTHYQIQTGSCSCIDLTICSSCCLADFDWRVLDDLHGSDHFPIVVSLANDPPMQRSPKWCLDRADWLKFKELSSISQDITELPSIAAAIELLNGKLFGAATQSIPKSTGRFRRRPVLWWSEDCRILHRATRRALTRYRRHRTEENLIEYKKCRACFRRFMKSARRQSWMSFVSSLNCKTPISLVWKKYKKIVGKYTPNPPPVIEVNGRLITNSKDVSNALADHFANVSAKRTDCPGSQYRSREEQLGIDFSTNHLESYNAPFSMREFDSALADCSNSAPGPDEIHYEMLKHVCEATKIFILSLINRIWSESNFPSVWEVAYLLPFLKPGKNPLSPSSYRPIALTSCLCKLMEKMVNVRLMWFLEFKGILSQAQCGFRKFHSTTDVLVRLESSICEAFASKQHHITVFFDLEKAYDTAWRFGILKALHDSGLRGELPLFIEAFLKHRYFYVKVGDTLSERKLQEEGVPQGSVLSVTLFALAINSLSTVIPAGILHTLYVDDLSISFAASRMSTAERQLQLCLDKIISWASKRGFRFSTSKTAVVHFCRIRGFHPDPDLFLCGQRIPCVENIRFLGLIFDNRLVWSPHIKALKANCVKALDILKVLSHSNWGAGKMN